MRKICHASVASLLVSDGDVIFSVGEIPQFPKMYFVCKGYLTYSSRGTDVQVMQEGQWISEGVLWVPWMHQGLLAAKGNGRLCVIDALTFQKVSGLFEHP